MVQYLHFRILKFPLILWWEHWGQTSPTSTCRWCAKFGCLFLGCASKLLSGLQATYMYIYIYMIWNFPLTYIYNHTVSYYNIYIYMYIYIYICIRIHIMDLTLGYYILLPTYKLWCTPSLPTSSGHRRRSSRKRSHEKPSSTNPAPQCEPSMFRNGAIIWGNCIIYVDVCNYIK